MLSRIVLFGENYKMQLTTFIYKLTENTIVKAIFMGLF